MFLRNVGSYTRLYILEDSNFQLYCRFIKQAPLLVIVNCVDYIWGSLITGVTTTTTTTTTTPWSESASELYRPSDRRLSAK
jgi:hypothetical protein